MTSRESAHAAQKAQVQCTIKIMSEEVWKRSPRKIRPARQSEVVDIGAKFGVSLGSGSDSSDAEFAPEEAELDSEDSRESDNESASSEGEGGSPEEEMEGAGETGGSPEGPQKKEEEYNPLIVRRSQRAIKPTKDVDLYLLSAQFGVCLDSEDADSSDMEFAPTPGAGDSDDVGSESGSSPASSVGGREGEGKGEGGGVKEKEQVASDDDDLDVSRSVSEISVAQGTADLKNIVIPLCCVCLEDSKDEGDIVACDSCGIAVHEGCYGVPEDDGVDDTRSDLSSFTTIPWFCDTCKAGVAAITCSCELCPNRGGLFKQAVNGRWVHMVCSLYTPGIEYVEPDQLSGIALDKVPASKWGARSCQLCEDERYCRTGVCIGCDAGLCKSFFHVTCAQQYGLLCEVESEDDEKDVADPYFAHCKAHSDKDTSKRKRRDYLTAMTKQKKFKFEEPDERILHYLQRAQQDYNRFFCKMQQYYKPEHSFQGEERLLHHVPSAFRRLTQKAQLLGLIPEGAVLTGGESKRRVAPTLTCEFVHYFTDRQVRVRSLREQGEQLVEVHKGLKEEEGRVRGELGRLEKELKSLRVHGHEQKCQATAIYTNLSRITSQNLPLPEFLGEREDKETEEEKNKCTICQQSHDPHMMALCDTCNNHYHISCLDPPLSRVPKKTSRWGWQCHQCCFSSGDELIPTIAGIDELASRSGRRIQPPKQLLYPEDQVKQSKKKKRKK